MTCFSFNVLSVNSLECISMKNQECKIRPEVANVNTNNPVFGGNCNNIRNPYAR